MMSTQAQIKSEQGRRILPLRKLMEQHGHAPGAGESWALFSCPVCAGGRTAAVREVAGKLVAERCIEDLRNRVDIAQVIGRAVVLKRSGAELTGLCPFHREKSPSFTVSPRKRMFKCFGCGVGGNVFRFLELYEGLKFREAVERLAGECGVALEFVREGREELVCSNGKCAAHEGVDEGGYLAAVLGVSLREGWLTWLREAGVKVGRRAAGLKPPQPPLQDDGGLRPPLQDVFPPSSCPGDGAAVDDGAHDDGRKPMVGGSSVQEPAGAGALGGAPAPVPPGGVGLGIDGVEGGEVPGPSGFQNGGEIPCDDTAPQQAAADGSGTSPLSPFLSVGGGNGDGGKVKGREDAGAGARRVLLEFWRRAAWTEVSAAALEVKRGLPAEASRLLGLRSNVRLNLEVLQGLVKEFDEEDRVASGLFSRFEDGRVVPNRQFYGWGLMGSAERMRRMGTAIPQGARIDGEGNVWFWTEPVLIPYWERMGERMELVAIRPHKGGAKGQPARLWTPVECGEGVGVPPGDWRPPRLEMACVCESELKAAAVWWVFRGSHFKVGACGVPGISQGKNEGIQGALTEWLRESGVRKVVVGFDSEEKGDSKLPGWKADPNKRYDAEAWAMYLAKWIGYQRMRWEEGESQCFDGRVAMLPKEWRDETGKADWDGVLARMWRGEGQLPREGGGGDPNLEGEKVSLKFSVGADFAQLAGGPRSERRLQAVRTEFLKVLNSAVKPGDVRQVTMFADWEQRIIANRLHELWYKPRIPWAGHREERIAERLEWLASRVEGWMPPYVWGLASSFREVNGWAYDRKPREIKREADKQAFHAACREVPKVLRAEKDPERKEMLRATLMFLEEWKRGHPFRVGSFKMDPVYMLIRRRGDKDCHERMVVLTNQMGEVTRPVLLEVEEMETPARFKGWCQLRGRYDWLEGENSLQWLKYDLNQGLLGRNVYEVNVLGWHEEGKFWMYGDCAIESQTDADLPAAIAHPDEYGVVYIGGIGYQLSESDWEKQDFKLGLPMMRPTMGLRFSDKPDADYVLKENKEDDLAALRDLYGEFCERMREMVCVTPNAADTPSEYGGYLMIGSIWSYFVAPEFFRAEGYFPGLWIDGERGGGKSVRAELLVKLAGFHQGSKIHLGQGTKTGLLISLQQYSNLPVYAEEAKNEKMSADVLEVLKLSHNRETPTKFEITGRSRKIRTAPLVVGEHTARDSGLAQRFPHINISDQRRWRADGSEVDHRPWMQKNADFFFQSEGICCGGVRSLWN